MKRLFTLLSAIFFVASMFAQAPKTVLYLTDPVPFATGDGKHDQEMFDLITSLGYLVTAEGISETSATTGYDVIFTSEAIGSGHGSWGRYKEAPLPMVMAKVWAVKGPALGWVAGENSGTDYGNSVDSIFIEVAEDHPITCDLDERFAIVHPGSTEGAIGAFVNFSVENPAGVNVIYHTEVSDAEHAVVTVDPFSTLNGNTLASRVVILGIHQVVYDEVNDNAAKLIDNCLKYAIDGDVNCETAVDEHTAISANVYPNPSIDGTFNVKLDQHIVSADISIMGLDGRILRTSRIENTESVTLDLSDLSSGIYIMSINGSQISFTQNIIVQ